MGKKLSRSRRKELREQGVFEAPSAAVEEAKREIRRAEASSSTSARAVIAKVEVAPREDLREDGDEAPAPSRKGAARPDRTVLVLIALTALAAVIFWLTQRSPTKETKIEAAPGAAPLSSAKR